MFAEHIKKVFTLGKQDYVMETGILARQAHGAVLVSVDETVVLATVVGNPNVKPGQDFFPLTVDYVEKSYAAGRIPGGFFKREGRPSEKEILTSRLIDRPLRPLFPDGFFNEIQVATTVLSLNPEVDADIPSMVAASAALAISGIPFDGPIGGVRIGYKDGSYQLNPLSSELPDSALNLVVAGTRHGVLMVESEAQELSEEIMLGAITFGHQHIQTIISAINDLAQTASRPKWNWQPSPPNQTLTDKVNRLAESSLLAAYRLTTKQARSNKIEEIYNEVLEKLSQEETPPEPQDVRNLLFSLESRIVRKKILSGEPRIDGRDTKTVRPLAIRHGLLPRTHGSALFVRGETQALVIATLGTNRDEQIIDALAGEYRERFMLHYNMPPFATGETGRLGSPKRREIGHGRLAKRALVAVLPKDEDFRYTIRLVSEVLESNGSSSMASVCGGSLALMDAGVPLKSHVAGIAMGLIKEGDQFAILTDILGDEDHLGDMDFKVAGTEQGITALQMDIKIQSITPQIMELALKQAKDGRLHILKHMNQAMTVHRENISAYAPRLITLKINPEKIRDVIGKGGAVIRALTEESGAVIDVSDTGVITIASVSQEGAALARKRIEEITAEVEVGKVYQGTVLRLLEFGAIVSILPGRDGLLHISQIANERVSNVGDFLKEGQTVRVKVLESDEKGRVRLSMKAI